MAPHELCGEAFDHVGKIERALLLRHAGVEHDLEQEIPELVAQVVEIAARNRVGDIVGLLDGVGGDGVEALLQVPRAAGAWRAQSRHDFDEPSDVARRSHRKIDVEPDTGVMAGHSASEDARVVVPATHVFLRDVKTRNDVDARDTSAFTRVLRRAMRGHDGEGTCFSGLNARLGGSPRTGTSSAFPPRR